MTPTPPHPPHTAADGVLDAIGVCTAAIVGDTATAEHLLRSALEGPAGEETLSALTSTIAMIGEEATEYGLDLRELLADIGLGVQLLALQQQPSAPHRSDAEPDPHADPGPDPHADPGPDPHADPGPDPAPPEEVAHGQAQQDRQAAPARSDGCSLRRPPA